MCEVINYSHLHFLRLIPALLLHNFAISTYQVSNIRRRAVSKPHSIIHLIYQYWYDYSLRGYRLARQFDSFVVGLWFIDRIPIFVITSSVLPSRIYRMCFLSIDYYEVNLITIFLSQGISSSAPLPERWSGERTKHHNNRFLTEQASQTNCIPIDIL